MKVAWSEPFDPDRLHEVVEPLPIGPDPRAWAWGGSTGRDITVAVVDSGVDASHPAVGHVEGGAAFTYDRESGEVQVQEGPHEDLFGHGTACAGIIRSIAPDCRLLSARVLGERLTGKVVAIVAGVRWALAHGAQVVNMSLSTGRQEYFALFHEVADQAYFAGVPLVCAVNNVPGPTYPSQYASVFSVACRPGDDPLGLDYNPAPPVEFGAAGIDLEVAWLGGKTIKSTGNSYAAPHVAGMLALILAKHPGLTVFQLKSVLHAVAMNARPAG